MTMRAWLGTVFVAVVPQVLVSSPMEEGKNQNVLLKFSYGLLLWTSSEICFKIFNYEQCTTKHISAVQLMVTVIWECVKMALVVLLLAVRELAWQICQREATVEMVH